MRGALPFLVLVLTGSSFGAAAPWVAGSRTQPQQAYPFTLDFETGDLRGWTASGTAFVFQPTLDDNPSARGRGQPSGHQGRYWIGTFERYQGHTGQKPGGTQGDEPRGTLTSGDFVVPSGFLAFLVGGGAGSATRVELQVWDQIESVWITARQASGKNSETMSPVRWDLSQLQGRRARLRVVDSSSAGWGHINADNFTFSEPGPFQQRPRPDTLPHLAAPQDSAVVVPDLLGRRLEVASEILAKATQARLQLGRVSRQASADPPGTVINQKPSSGTAVPLGTPVDVLVAAPVAVPPLVGRNITVARRALDEAQLAVGAVASQSSPRAAGTVLDQTPEAGTPVPLHSPIDLVVAAGVTVPELAGRDSTTAMRLLRDAQLRPGAIQTRPSADPAGTVVEQHPVAGEQVALASSVDLVIAAAVSVPDLLDLDAAGARQQLADAGLTLLAAARRLSFKPSGTVLAQQPGPGSLVPLGTQVSLTLARHVPMEGVGAGLLALLGGAGLFIRRRAHRQRSRSKSEPADPAPGVAVLAHPDPGTQTIEAGTAPALGVELRIRVMTDPGEQRMGMAPSPAEDNTDE